MRHLGLGHLWGPVAVEERSLPDTRMLSVLKQESW